MPATYIQSASTGANGVNSQTLAFPSGNTEGNLILVVVGIAQTFGSGTLSLTDSNGNTYELIQSYDSGGELVAQCLCYYAKNIAGGANAVTFSDTGETDLQNITIAIAEYAGLSISAPLVSEVQAPNLGGPGGINSFSLPNSASISWTVQYDAENFISVFGAVFFTDGNGNDALIEYEWNNDFATVHAGYPNTSSPDSLAFTIRENYSGPAPEIQLYDELASASPAVTTLPPIPPPEYIEWDLGDTVGSARSPFSRQRQIHNWNASILRATLTYATMYNSVAISTLLVFLMDTLGIANTFLFGDPQNRAPQNPSAVAGTVTGAGQTGYTLVTSSSGLTPGDWIQVGQRLYRVQTVDGGTLGIWPNLRQSPPDGAPLIILNTQGLFRLAKNQRSYSVKPGQIVSPITIEIEEAF